MAGNEEKESQARWKIHEIIKTICAGNCIGIRSPGPSIPGNQVNPGAWHGAILAANIVHDLATQVGGAGLARDQYAKNNDDDK